MAEDDGKVPPFKVASAGGLILLQVFARFLTLFMTQMQVRFTSAEILGAANIHFEILLGLILTLSRDGFRTALSRSTVSDSTRNVSLLPIPIGIAISTIVMSIYTRALAPSELTGHSQFAWATRTLWIGALLELFAEPLYIDCLIQVDTMTRVKAEGIAIAVKSITTLSLLFVMQDASTLLPFGLGQMAFGGTFSAVLWLSHAKKRGLQESVRYLFPIPIKEGNLFNSEALWLSLTMTRQNIVKHVLGEGDKFAVAKLASLSDQGAYALASNYGSLVARILYQPLEESSRLTFARALGDSSTSVSKVSIDLASKLLQTLLSFYVLLSLFLVTFCPPYSTTLLLILAGRRWALETSAPAILGAYGSMYLPAMAFNGLLEGFLQACAPPSQLTRYALVLVAASGVFVATLFTFHQFNYLLAPEKSLILATTLSTLMRAAYSYRFTLTFLKQKQQNGKAISMPLNLVGLMAHPATLATFALSAAIVYWKPYSTEMTTKGGLPLTHLLTGLTCALMCLGACITFERNTLLGTLRAVRGKQEQVVG